MIPPFVYVLFHNLPALEVAITFGLIFFALSWVMPRRLITLPVIPPSVMTLPVNTLSATTLPATVARRSILVWTGIAGSLLVVAVATVASALAARRGEYQYTGVDGWLGRPAPLLTAITVVAVAALVLRRSRLPEPGARGIAPRRPWHAFAPRPVLWATAVLATLVALTALWQSVIGMVAPEAGPFFGRTTDHTDLPIYMTFNQGYGYIAGVGWPNYLATFVVLAIAAVVLFLALRSDANRPVLARSSFVGVRVEREQTARLLTLIVLGGLVTTLGAVWMHAGSIGQVSVSFDQRWVSEDVSYPRIHFGGGYDAFARPLNLAGYAFQGIGVALLLRIATDTTRSALKLRRAGTDAPSDVDDAALTPGARR
ncbi:hypothetical protein B0I08_107162 [Glaciihabitans tibetensis]|uniref:Uncharacterized protein n=1 Tax=Glaciihabitans tibetensis TaxID=1266600 RepID=A0A2T0VAP5_9MICO|nr:hypothetical protein [Glaciihabitans tibetensis]PRY67266.1 hypothetical protein B0I08_107162 [Glaciihabitans tibetensis]